VNAPKPDAALGALKRWTLVGLVPAWRRQAASGFPPATPCWDLYFPWKGKPAARVMPPAVRPPSPGRVPRSGGFGAVGASEASTREPASTLRRSRAVLGPSQAGEVALRVARM
jgi:hypothetical protein